MRYGCKHNRNFDCYRSTCDDNDTYNNSGSSNTFWVNILEAWAITYGFIEQVVGLDIVLIIRRLVTGPECGHGCAVPPEVSKAPNHDTNHSAIDYRTWTLIVLVVNDALDSNQIIWRTFDTQFGVVSTILDNCLNYRNNRCITH